MQDSHYPGSQDRSAREPAPTRPVTSEPGWSGQPGEPGDARALGRLAVACILCALLVMVGASLLRSSWMPPPLAMPASGPPWELTAHLPARVIAVSVWMAGLLGVGGLAAGLLAVRRGQPMPVRTLIAGAAAAVVALTVLPPVGSTDALDYAIYGHIAALGHSPYVMTPFRYGLRMHLSQGVPLQWEHAPSVYGPLATLEQLAAAWLGGASLAVTVFWLKLANALGFAAIGYAADRLLRADPAARLRAHLLWTANPLLIWSLIAGGHLDVLAGAAGLAGLLLLGGRARGASPRRALAAGLCVGAAADIKIAYLLFGLAVLWSLRGQPRQQVAVAGAAAAVLLPSYALAGVPAVSALVARVPAGFGYGFYGLFFRPLGIGLGVAVPAAVLLIIPVALLALSRLPEGSAGRPAIRVALAGSLAWLLVWPHQYAWYSVMIICVLVFYPASRLDWVALAWLGALTVAGMPGVGVGTAKTLGPVLASIRMAPLAEVVMLGALAAFVVLCLTERWNAVPGRGLAGPPPAEAISTRSAEVG